MDKELLRIAIIGTGLIIIVGMIISAYLKDKQAHEEEDDYYDDEEEFEDDNFEDEDDVVGPTKKRSLTEFLKNVYSQKIQQFQKSTSHLDNDEFEPKFDVESEPPVKQKEPEAPKRTASTQQSILQFSVITQGDEDFNVAKIFYVLENLGLEYGSMKVFELIDENRIVHFCVADMDPPGTFPDEDLENHYCSGVTFFMDFDGLENPRDVFEDYVHTAAIFAEKMDGQILDHRRRPLTDAMVNAIRNNLDNYKHS